MIRKFPLIACGLLLLLAAVGGGAVYGQSEETESNWIADFLTNQLSTPGGPTISIGHVGGSIAGRVVLTDVSVGDAEGEWLHVDEARVVWRPTQLLRRTFHAESVEISGVRVLRAPIPGEDPEPQTDEPFEWPSLPVSVVIDQFEIADIDLAEPFLGIPARLRAAGQFGAEREGDVRTALTVERTDGATGRVEAEALFRPDTEFLRLSAEVTEPAGGLIPRALGLADLPPVEIRVAGEGPLSEWQGNVVGDLGGQAGVDADVTLVRTGEDYGLTLSGNAQVESLLDPTLQSIVTGGVELAVEAHMRGTQVVGIDRARVTTQAIEVELSAEADLAQNRIGGRANVQIHDADAIAPFTAPAALEGASVQARFAGDLFAPRLEVEADVAQVTAPELAASGVHATAVIEPSRPLTEGAFAGAFSADGSIETLRAGPPEAADMIAGPTSWRISGEADLAQQRITVAELQVENPQARATATAAADLAAQAFEVDGSVALSSVAPLSALAGIPLSGAAELGFEAQATEGGRQIQAEFDGALRNIESPEAPLTLVFGDETRLRGSLATDAAAGQQVGEIAVDGRGLRLTAKAALPQDYATVDAEYRLEVDDLAPFAPLTGTDMAGRGAIAGTVTGPTADPTVTTSVTIDDAAVAGQPLGQITGEARVENAVSAPAGRVEVAAEPQAIPVRLSTDFALRDNHLRLDDIRATAPETDITGQIAMPMDGTPATGALNGQIGSLAPWLALGGIDGRGSGSLQLRLAARDGQQAVDGNTTFTGIRVAPGGPDGAIRVGRAAAEFQATLGEPIRQNVRLTATDLGFDGGSVARLTVTAAGTQQNTDVRIAAQGDVAGPFTLETRGQVAYAGDRVAVTLASLNSTFNGQRFAVRRPAQVVLEGESLTVSDLVVEAAGGSIRLAADMTPEQVSGTLGIRALPLSLVSAVSPDTDLAGTVSGQARFQGSAANPTGNADITFADVRLVEDDNLPVLAGRITADWRRGRLTTNATVSGFAEQPLTAQAEIPLRLEPGSFAPAVPPNGPVSARMNWQGEIQPIWVLLPLDEHRLNGQGNVALAVTGTVAAPRVEGSVTLDGGGYENLITNTILRDISLRLDAEGDRLTLTRLSATDGGNGTLQGTGYVGLSPVGEPAEIRITTRNLTVVRRDEVTGAVNADLAYSDSGQGARLSGTIETAGMEIRLINNLPPTVVKLDVVEKDGGRITYQAEQTDVPTVDAPATELDLQISLPNRVFVRGRGLDSEWSGAFAIGGTAADPQITGSLNSIRGQLSLLGQTLVLQDSEIGISKNTEGQFEAALDIAAEQQAPQLTILVRITGTATAPKLELTSTPELPQDEVLARLLFGRASAQLTPLEAVQLAAAVAELTGSGGGGILDLTRNALGVDVLRVQSDPTDEEAGPTVQAGRYISDKVFVGVEQGLHAGSSAVSVEIEVFPHVKLRSGVGQTGDANVGVRVEWDY